MYIRRVYKARLEIMPFPVVVRSVGLVGSPIPASDQLEIQPLVLFLLVQKEELRHLEENHE